MYSIDINGVSNLIVEKSLNVWSMGLIKILITVPNYNRDRLY